MSSNMSNNKTRHFSPTIINTSTSNSPIIPDLNTTVTIPVIMSDNQHNNSVNNDNDGDYSIVLSRRHKDDHVVSDDDELALIALECDNDMHGKKNKTNKKPITNTRPLKKPAAKQKDKDKDKNNNNKNKNKDAKASTSCIGDNSAYMIDLFKFTDEQRQLDPVKEVFIQYSLINNDDLVKWYHLQHSPQRYICSSKGCPTHKGMWRRKPAYLILSRKNGNNRDNRLTNIEYRCPNCYFQDYGTEIFIKAKQGLEQRVRKCANDCGRTLSAAYNGTYCYGCRKRIEKYDMTAPTISQLVNISASLNYEDLDDDERAEQVAMLQEIYNTDLEVEAVMKRNGMSASQIDSYKPSSNKSKSRHHTSNNGNKSNAPDIDTDMTGVLDDLSDDDNIEDVNNNSNGNYQNSDNNTNKSIGHGTRSDRNTSCNDGSDSPDFGDNDDDSGDDDYDYDYDY